MSTKDFYVDVSKIRIAHEFTLDQVKKCEYPRGRGSYGLVYALDGQAEYRFLGGERVLLSKGDLFFISPDASYSIVTPREFHHYTVNFDIHGASSSAEMLDMPYCLLGAEHTAQLEGGLGRLVALWRAKRIGYEMQCVSLLYEILALFYLQYVGQTNEKNDERLLRARGHIEQHFAEPISLRDLAYLCNMSVTNFRREWKKRYLESPIKYRDTVRMYYAKELLRSGYYSVADVAQKCGFEDVSYFVRSFGQKVGMTPNQFKKANR